LAKFIPSSNTFQDGRTLEKDEKPHNSPHGAPVIFKASGTAKCAFATGRIHYLLVFQAGSEEKPKKS